MAKEEIPVGSTSIKQRIAIVNASTGAAITGLAYNSSGLAGNYFRDGDTSLTAITFVTASLGTYTSAGFKEVGHGVYEIGIPNAVFANSVRDAIVIVDGYSGMAPVYLEFQLQNTVGVTVTTNNDKTGYALSTTPPTAAQIAAVILSNTSNLLATDSSGRVTPVPSTIPTTAQIAAAILANTSNLLATDGSGRVTLIPADVPPTVAAIAAGILATPANLLTTNAAGDVTVAGYATGQDPYTLVMETADTVDGITNAETVIQWLRIIMAALAGQASGLATTTAVFEAITNAKARITATVDANGDRSAVTLNGT